MGETVGDAVVKVGETVGAVDGKSVGDVDGEPVGNAVGDVVGS